MSQQEKILLWCSNLWVFGGGLLGPLFAVFAEEIGGNILDITSAWAIYMIVTGILTMFVGKISDTVGHERLLLYGLSLSALLTFGYLFVTTPLMLIMLQAGLGVATALVTPTWAALFDQFSVTEKDGYLWGVAYGHSYIASGVAAILGGLLVSYYSFQVLFVVMGIIQIAAAGLQFKLNRRMHHPHAKAP